MRGPLEGIWLKDVRGWKLTFRNDFGNVLQVLSHTNPGRLVEPIRCSLDGIGTLEQLTFDWKGRFEYDPSTITCLLELLDATKGWQEVAEGWLEQPHSRRKRSSPMFSNFWKLVQDDFYSSPGGSESSGNGGGIPPSIPVLYISSWNFLGGGLPAGDVAENVLKTNSQIMQSLFEGSSDASVGVDAQRRMILARPGVGAPVGVDANDLVDWDIGDWTQPPYITKWAASHGKNWVVFSGTGGPSGRLVPRKARVASTNLLETKAGGMTLIGSYFGRITPLPSPNPTPIPPQFMSTWGNPSGPSFEIQEGRGKAVYLVLDPQGWYEGSVLKRGPSNYEPVSAYLKIGVTLLELPPAGISGEIPDVVLDEAIWISESGLPDENAVGEPLVGVGLDPSPVHPQHSSRTKDTLRQNARVRLYLEDIGKVQYIDYPIPDALFRQDQTEKYGSSWSLQVAVSWLLEARGNSSAVAKVRFHLEALEFGSKVSEPTDTQVGLGLSAWVGPTCKGEARGGLVTPATVSNLEIKDGVFVSQNVVSTTLNITTKKTTSEIVTGILPYPERIRNGVGQVDYGRD